MIATVYRLASERYGGRRVGTPGGRSAGAWLAEQLRSLGAAVSVDEFPVPGVPELSGANVYGVLAEPVPGGASVLLTAHYDGVGDLPDRRRPAAADNASGVAVVLEAGRRLALTLPSGVGLTVAFLDAEEIGALGSAHHAGQLPSDTYVINVDGAAQLDQAAAVEAGGPAEPLLAALDRAGRQIELPLRAGAVASDNRRYAAAGLPAVGLGMGAPGYHTPADTPDRVDPATLAVAVLLVTTTVRQLCR